MQLNPIVGTVRRKRGIMAWESGFERQSQVACTKVSCEHCSEVRYDQGNSSVWTLLENPMPTVYLASPLGFSPEYRAYRERIKARLAQLGYQVFDPWEQPFSKAIREASGIEDYHERIAAFTRLAKDIGAVNEEAIRECDILLGVLDGADVDSGTASEIGFAMATGKRCF